MKLGPLNIKDEKQRKFMLIAAFISIIGFIVYLKDRQAKAAADGSGTQGLDIGGGLGGPGTSGSIGGGGSGDPFQTIIDAVNAIGDKVDGIGGTVASSPGTKLSLNYQQQNDSSFTSTSSYGKNRGGSSFSLGGGGFSLGFGGGGSSVSREAAFSETSSDIFTNDSSAENITARQQTELLNFFNRVGGSYADRTNAQAARDKNTNARLAATINATNTGFINGSKHADSSIRVI